MKKRYERKSLPPKMAKKKAPVGYPTPERKKTVKKCDPQQRMKENKRADP